MLYVLPQRWLYMFTFVTMRSNAYSVTSFYGSREDADIRYDQITAKPGVIACYFYGAEEGLINFYRNPSALT